MKQCTECGKETNDLRPYGKDFALICFACGMEDEEQTKRNFNLMLNSSGPVAQLTERGPEPITPNKH